jgi:hypothetical protein
MQAGGPDQSLTASGMPGDRVVIVPQPDLPETTRGIDFRRRRDEAQMRMVGRRSLGAEHRANSRRPAASDQDWLITARTGQRPAATR